jgi:hypothetical protein
MIDESLDGKHSESPMSGFAEVSSARSEHN